MTVSAIDALLLLVVGWLCYQVGGLRATAATVARKAIDAEAAMRAEASRAANLVRSWAIVIRRLQERVDALEAKATRAPVAATPPTDEPEKKVTTPEYEPLLPGEMPPMPDTDPLAPKPSTEVGQAE